jgi:hypothetical protein
VFVSVSVDILPAIMYNCVATCHFLPERDSISTEGHSTTLQAYTPKEFMNARSESVIWDEQCIC